MVFIQLLMFSFYRKTVQIARDLNDRTVEAQVTFPPLYIVNIVTYVTAVYFILKYVT